MLAQETLNQINGVISSYKELTNFFRLTNVQRDNEGRYKCEALLPGGVHTFDFIHLTVMSKLP